MSGEGHPAGGDGADRVRELSGLCLEMGEALVAFAQQVIGDREAAEDVVWVAHARLCERILSGEEVDVRPGYLVRAVRNAALNLHDARVNRVDPAWLSAAAEGVSAVPTPFDLLLRKRRREITEDVMHEIPDRQREVVELVDLQGWSRAEAAKRMGTTENNVKQQLRRARKRLRKIATARGLTSMVDI